MAAGYLGVPPVNVQVLPPNTGRAAVWRCLWSENMMVWGSQVNNAETEGQADGSTVSLAFEGYTLRAMRVPLTLLAHPRLSLEANGEQGWDGHAVS